MHIEKEERQRPEEENLPDLRDDVLCSVIIIDDNKLYSDWISIIFRCKLKWECVYFWKPKKRKKIVECKICSFEVINSFIFQNIYLLWRSRLALCEDIDPLNVRPRFYFLYFIYGINVVEYYAYYFHTNIQKNCFSNFFFSF